jgi:hypothetical protein
VFRDLETLREAGVPLVYDEQEQRHRIPINFYLPPTNFTPEEALALLVLCYELGDRSGLPFQTSARQAALKLESNLPTKLRSYVREVADAVQIRLASSSRAEGHEAVYLQLLEAVRNRRAVRITYRSLSEQQALVTRSCSRINCCSVAVVGMSSVARPFIARPGSSIYCESKSWSRWKNRFVPRPVSRWTGFCVTPGILFPNPVPIAKSSCGSRRSWPATSPRCLWHKTQRLVWLPDGRLEFHATVSGIHEISWWILGYGDQAEVVQPPDLRELIARRVSNVLAKLAGPVAAGSDSVA